MALGLELREAVIGGDGRHPSWEGYTWFRGDGFRIADALSTAVGIAWEQDRGNTSAARGDTALLRRHGYDAADIRTLVIAARAILADRQKAHQLVTDALLEKTVLTGRDLAMLAAGAEFLDED